MCAASRVKMRGVHSVGEPYERFMNIPRTGPCGPTLSHVACVAAWLTIGAGACASAPSAGDDLGASAGASVWAVDAARPVTDAAIFPGKPPRVADAGYFGTVVAAGVGCPAGTWGVIANARGDGLELMFTALAIELADGATSAQTSCTLNLKLSPPTPLSYAFAGARWEGVASLSRGVTASQSIRASVLGDPGSRATVVGEQLGPRDDVFEHQQQVPGADRKWSRCVATGDLSVQIDLRLLRTVPTAKGYLYLRKLIAIELATRACDG